MTRTQTVVLMLTLLAFTVLPASALVVHVPDDEPTIQDGVNAAGKGDTVLVAAGTYSGELNRDIDFGGTDVVLRAPSGPKLTIIDCLDSTRAFHLHSGEDTTSVIEGFTIFNGRRNDLGGGVLCDGASMKFVDCIFEGNWCADRGGAIACLGSSSVFVGCEFFGNSCEYALYGEGGVVYCTDGSSLAFRACEFWSNSADIGAAVACTGASSAVMRWCLFWENAADSGGAVACRGSSTMILEQCTMDANISVAGVGVFCDGGSLVEASGSIISFGSKGTAARCYTGGEIVLSCCDVYGNEYGDWVGCIADQHGVTGNFHADPLYCGFANIDRRHWLHADSPCAAENSGGCGLVGAFGVGCDSTPVKAISWGRVKALFR